MLFEKFLKIIPIKNNEHVAFRTYSSMLILFQFVIAWRDVWVQNLIWRAPTGCPNSDCLSKGYTWPDGTPLELGVFSSIQLYDHRNCWLYKSQENALRSEYCHQTRKITCQLDCRPGKIIMRKLTF